MTALRDAVAAHTAASTALAEIGEAARDTAQTTYEATRASLDEAHRFNAARVARHRGGQVGEPPGLDVITQVEYDRRLAANNAAWTAYAFFTQAEYDTRLAARNAAWTALVNVGHGQVEYDRRLAARNVAWNRLSPLLPSSTP